MSDPETSRDPIEELASEYVERLRKDENPSVTEYVEKHPERADEIRDLFPTIAAMEQLKVAKERGASGRASLGPAQLKQLGDYRIIREIGRGGMGVVYEAVQESLGRHVAVKVLPRSALLDPRALKRFQREARLAAQLHHSNIAAVFGVGEQDQFHYYVMQYIRGVPLDRIIEHLKEAPSGGNLQGAAAKVLKQDGRGGKHTTVELNPPTSVDHWRAVARMARQVALAVHYAHRQGTLHRDIKPSNLLVDDRDHVWVTDFGLARPTRASDVSRSGEVSGTLRYMAPERFQGNADERSDVCSLGLTFYELLVLRPAFEATDRNVLIKQISQSEPPRPRKVDPGIPEDLETIILKAIARDPRHRYASAEAMADDLQRFIEDEPIHARRPSNLELFTRWCRRNPAVVSLSAATIMMIVAVAVVASVGYVRTKAALKGEAEERRKAEASSALAEAALDRLFERLGPVRQPYASELKVAGTGGSVAIPNAPLLSREAAGLLEEMVAFYDKLAARASDDASLRRKAAQATRRVGEIRHRLGQHDAAVGAYERSIRLIQRLEPTDGTATKIEIAAIQNEIGRIHHAERKHEEARDTHLIALRILEPLVEGTATDADARYELARTNYLLGIRRQIEPGKRPPSDQPPDRPPRKHDGPPGKRHPHPPELGPPHHGPMGGPPPEHRPPPRGGDRRPPHEMPPRSDDRPDQPPISEPVMDLELLQEKTGYLAKGIELLDTLINQHPENPRYRHLQALCLRERASLEQTQDRASAESMLARATKLLEELVRDFPKVPDYTYDLCEAYALRHWQDSRSRPDELAQIRTHLKKALAVAERLVSEHPNIPDYLATKARIHHKLASVLRRSGSGADAEQNDRLAIGIQTSLVRQFRDDPYHRIWLAAYRDALIAILMHHRRETEATSLLENNITMLAKLPEMSPDLWFVNGMLARNYENLSDLLRRKGAIKEAKELESRALKHHDRMRERQGAAGGKR